MKEGEEGKSYDELLEVTRFACPCLQSCRLALVLPFD